MTSKEVASLYKSAQGWMPLRCTNWSILDVPDEVALSLVSIESLAIDIRFSGEPTCTITLRAWEDKPSAAFALTRNMKTFRVAFYACGAEPGAIPLRVIRVGHREARVSPFVNLDMRKYERFAEGRSGESVFASVARGSTDEEIAKQVFEQVVLIGVTYALEDSQR